MVGISSRPQCDAARDTFVPYALTRNSVSYNVGYIKQNEIVPVQTWLLLKLFSSVTY